MTWWNINKFRLFNLSEIFAVLLCKINNSNSAKKSKIQSNLNISNTNGSFTMVISNSFLSPYEIFPIAQENKYLGTFSYLIMNLYVVYTH